MKPLVATPNKPQPNWLDRHIEEYQTFNRQMLEHARSQRLKTLDELRKALNKPQDPNAEFRLP